MSEGMTVEFTFNIGESVIIELGGKTGRVTEAHWDGDSEWYVVQHDDDPDRFTTHRGYDLHSCFG